jgi:transcriptional regulator with XRE-family HTH domain
MQTDFSIFGERLAEACRVRGKSYDRLCSRMGLPTRRVGLKASDLKALDIERLAQMADMLDVSIDWLLGRTEVMNLPNGN